MSDNSNDLTTTSPQVTQPVIPTVPTVSVNLQQTPQPPKLTVNVPDQQTLINSFMSGAGGITNNMINQIAKDYAQAVTDIANAANEANSVNADIIYGVGLGMIKAAEFLIQSLIMLSIIDPDLYAQNLMAIMSGQDKAKDNMKSYIQQKGVTGYIPGTIPGTGSGNLGRGGF